MIEANPPYIPSVNRDQLNFSHTMAICVLALTQQNRIGYQQLSYFVN
ncbi:hypothetical protein VCRA2119O147_1570007 [Vibrio crassostreae]|nr:hypothetical protein VCRA2119O145_350065 [Vibrio crassostreae]CAK2058818.1 hypothetical protein VCRA2118O144_370065 [Vibrio crassostreae]CAK2228367.1 hypothetical protein VCRA2113O206_740002 [Vibrio crassostreae]CAK2288733.1 hypothetical protein VCRA2119O147_1570007 [Vibrio crassostreae]CAK2388498.1 hypothetical protein VCRA2117O143_860003 [Vibrio crassostreae]